VRAAPALQAAEKVNGWSRNGSATANPAKLKTQSRDSPFSEVSMRKILLTMLLAGTAFSPALGQRTARDDWSGPRHDRSAEQSQSREERAQIREERSQAREERSQAREQVRAEHAERVEPRNVTVRDRPVEVSQMPADVQARRAQLKEQVRARADDGERVSRNVNGRGRPTLPGSEGDRVSNAQRDQFGDAVQQRVDRRADRHRVRAPEGARPDRPAPLPQTALHRDRRDRDHHWRTDWRKDHRHDWRNHRRHHRSLFHLGFYFDPFGWRYQRFNIGWRLWPSYYSSNYWLNDPSMYALPYAPYPYRWVRYWNDAVLVDTFTGEVVDVIHDFFW
jgi:Ni/Co efflux regulator RcnB